MKITINVSMSNDQRFQLYLLRRKYKEVLGEDLTDEELLERMLFMGFNSWFDDRRRILESSLGVMEATHKRLTEGGNAVED